VVDKYKNVTSSLSFATAKSFNREVTTSSSWLAMAFPLFIPVAVLAIGLYILKKLYLDRKSNALPLPPGPKGLPLLGNVNDLPPPGAPEYQHWLKHKDQYGPISSVTVLGQTLIILHDKQAAFELMERRANIHSGRPKMKFGFDMYIYEAWAMILCFGDTDDHVGLDGSTCCLAKA